MLPRGYKHCNWLKHIEMQYGDTQFNEMLSSMKYEQKTWKNSQTDCSWKWKGSQDIALAWSSSWLLIRAKTRNQFIAKSRNDILVFTSAKTNPPRRLEASQEVGHQVWPQTLSSSQSPSSYHHHYPHHHYHHDIITRVNHLCSFLDIHFMSDRGI